MGLHDVLHRTGTALLVVLLAGASAGCATTGSMAGTPRVVTDDHGVTLYRFDKDKRGSGESACYGTCASHWPPVPAARADGARFGSLTRADGTLQLTYDGWPLYYYAGDSGAGDMKGDAIGGVWHVVKTQTKKRSSQSVTGGGGY